MVFGSGIVGMRKAFSEAALGRSLRAMRYLFVDGFYYIYRSFFAIRNLSNSRGEPTNAIYGFTKAVRKMLVDLEPDGAAVLWDEGLPEHRVELQPEYKANRPEMPEEMVPQIEPIQKIAVALGLHSITRANTEADDLIASYVKQLGPSDEAIIATNDKDIYQLVSDRVKIYSTAKADLASAKAGFALLDAGAVEGKWGVPPEKIGEVLALTGDSVDNIPGIPGVGAKTAAKLVREFGSVDRMLENVERIGNKRAQEAIREGGDRLLQNREMVRLEDALPLPVPLSEMTRKPDYPGLIELLRACEFKSLLAECEAEARGAGVKNPDELF